MPYSMSCPSCNRQHRIEDNLLGKRAQCSCGHVMAIPAGPAQQPVAPPRPAAGIIVNCPSCGRQHQADASMAGTAARCGCGGVVHVPGGRAQYPQSGMQAAPGIDMSQASAPLGLDNLSADELTGAGYASPYHGYASQGEFGGAPFAGHGVPPAEPQRRSDDEVLAGYVKDDSWKQRDQYSQGEHDDDFFGPFGYFGIFRGFGFARDILNGGVIGGTAAILFGIALFVVPMMYGYIAPYSLVLVILGMIAVGRGLMNS